MTQVIGNHSRSGWQEDEIDLLFSAVQEATQEGTPLRNVFADVGEQLSRKPNSIRNFYYARVREVPELAPRQSSFRTFSQDELNELLRNVLIGRGQGESVRACVTRLAGGDRSGMLRYQNKYRSILKNKPELLVSIADELKAEGLPCPDVVISCRRYDRSAKADSSQTAQELTSRLSDPLVAKMLDGLCELLRRGDVPAQTAYEMSEELVPYRKWAEARQEADRLRVEVDLLKIALEDIHNASENDEDDTM
ncbi:MAG: hypothetical protein GX096_07840 [Clostridiales bacterium]|nr:hypothetical protein [Clostridiales bacterium]